MSSAVATARPIAPQVRRSRRGVRLLRATTLYQRSVAFLFGVVMLLSVATQAWNVAGIPVRAVVAGALLAVLAANNRRETYVAVWRHRNLFLLTIAIALIGIVVSIVAKNKPDEIIKQVMEIHVQTAVNLLLGAIVVEVCGASTVFAALIGAILLSAIFAVAQFVGFQPAWALRITIASISGESDKASNLNRTRPPGLSLSKITLATQMCLALAALFIRQTRLNAAKGRLRKNDPIIAVAVAVFVVACMASGNRSPILGGLAFYVCYLVRNRPVLFIAAVPIAVVAIPLSDYLIDQLQSTGLRAFSTGDKSSEGRQTLVYYGWRLLNARPFGYGLGFDPRLHWEGQWPYIRDLPNAIVVRTVELHNYALNMLNYYGVMILGTLPFIGWMLYRRRMLLLGFIPYCVHIVFHNYGPFQNDTLIMFLIAAAVGPFVRKSRRGRRSQRRSTPSRAPEVKHAPLPEPAVA